jgi:hypothetical protein
VAVGALAANGGEVDGGAGKARRAGFLPARGAVSLACRVRAAGVNS